MENGTLQAALMGRLHKLVSIEYRPDGDTITGGAKAWDCGAQDGSFRRVDGAWFTFTIEIDPRAAGGLAIEKYAFQLCFPPGSCPRYVRIELDKPDSAHAAEGLRSHLTPGHPDLRLPAPVLSPAEWLDVILYSTPSPPSQ